MSVLACDRNGCDNIMCDFYSPQFGYICYNCREELLETQGTMSIGQFMETPKSESKLEDYHSWRRYIEDVFDGRYK
ncbi:hypothetical protein D3C85_474680 [compost metagenome]